MLIILYAAQDQQIEPRGRGVGLRKRQRRCMCFTTRIYSLFFCQWNMGNEVGDKENSTCFWCQLFEEDLWRRCRGLVSIGDGVLSHVIRMCKGVFQEPRSGLDVARKIDRERRLEVWSFQEKNNSIRAIYLELSCWIYVRRNADPCWCTTPYMASLHCFFGNGRSRRFFHRRRESTTEPTEKMPFNVH